MWAVWCSHFINTGQLGPAVLTDTLLTVVYTVDNSCVAYIIQYIHLIRAGSL